MLRKSRSKRSKLFVDNIDLSWLLWPNRSVENDLTLILYFRHSHQKLCFFARTGVESNRRVLGSESRVLAHWAAGGERGSSLRDSCPGAHPPVAHPRELIPRILSPGARPLGAHLTGHHSLGESFPGVTARIASTNGPV